MNRMSIVRGVGLAAVFLLSLAQGVTGAQDRLKSMPGYDRYARMSREMGGAYRAGTLPVKWLEGGNAFEYRKDGKTYRYEVATRAAAEAAPSSADPTSAADGRGFRGQMGGASRGRQLESAVSPDGKLKAFYRNRNVWLSDANGGEEFPVTRDGSERDRIKSGTASWVPIERFPSTTLPQLLSRYAGLKMKYPPSVIASHQPSEIS